MRLQIVGHISVAYLLVSAFEHLEPAPIRLVPAADTVVSNGPAPFFLKVRAIDARGEELSPRGRSYAVSSNGVVALPQPGVARCLRQGDAKVVARQGDLSTAMIVKCRPIANFGMPMFARLELGQAPVLPTIIAYDSSGALITEFSGTATVRDTSVLRYKDGWLTPVGVGGTRVEMDFGGVASYQPIQVVKRVLDQPIDLSAGEIRAWPLPSGRSELFMVSDSTDASATKLLLRVFSANCARGPRRAGEQHLYCIATPTSRAIVRDMRPIGARGAARATLRMWAMK